MSRTTEGRREGDWIITPTGKLLYRGGRAVQSAVRMAEATPMIVTAETPHGVSAAGPWPLMLDGILAGVAHRGHADIGVVDHHVPMLPLVRSRGLSETFQGGDRAGRGRKQWWWMASAGMYDRDDVRGIDADAVLSGTAASATRRHLRSSSPADRSNGQRPPRRTSNVEA